MKSYISAMVKETRRTGAEPAHQALPSFSSLPEEGEGGGGGVPTSQKRIAGVEYPGREDGVPKPQKRIDAVELSEPRKRGGQPGNRNALKTGWNTAHSRALRSEIWAWRRQTSALLKLAEDVIAAGNSGGML
jgi:hypothetical protein